MIITIYINNSLCSQSRHNCTGEPIDMLNNVNVHLRLYIKQYKIWSENSFDNLPRRIFGPWGQGRPTSKKVSINVCITMHCKPKNNTYLGVFLFANDSLKTYFAKKNLFYFFFQKKKTKHKTHTQENNLVIINSPSIIFFSLINPFINIWHV